MDVFSLGRVIEEHANVIVELVIKIKTEAMRNVENEKCGLGLSNKHDGWHGIEEADMYHLPDFSPPLV